LWTAHNIGVDNTGAAGGTTNRNAARWYELQNLATTPSVLQAGTLFDNSGPNDANQRNYWYPTIMVSGQGHAALGCSIAGTNEYVNAFTTGRLASDLPGTLRDGPGGVALPGYTSSSTAYNPPGDDGGGYARRWGDYSATSLDPNDDMTMWTIQEYCNGTNTFGCRVAKLLAPPPATPASADSNVPSGQSSVDVTITGTVVSGSGFYDPGAGFPNHISATVSGGVLVNSTTYIDPTHVALNLNTTGASTGAKDVTVTNPDGQSRTGVGILNPAPTPTPTPTPAPGPFTNGSFESDYTGWSHTGNQNIYTPTLAPTTDGTKGVQFNGAQAFPNGVLSQTFLTTAGTVYNLNFDLGVFSYQSSAEQKVRVTVVGSGTLLSQDISVFGIGTGTAFTPKAFTFTANSSSTTLSFTDLSPATQNIDLLLDNVRVTSGGPPTLQLTAAVSRKTHGAAAFDINLPLTGEPGVECRSTGGNHTLVFTFNNNVVSGSASVTTGIGSVSGSPIFADNTMTVDLTGVADVQKITVTLSGVTDSFSQVLPDTVVSVNMLIGDTTGNKAVNSSDIAQTKAQSGIQVSGTNCREDVTVNGSINSSDIALVKSRSGFGVP
jgi:hypothetical protein